MLRPFAVLASFSALVCLSGIAPAQTGGVDPTPAVSGYVTRISSPSDFDVNGLRVLFGPKTRTLLGSTDPYAPRITGGEAFFGERVDLYGRIDRKKHQIEATEIVFCKFKPEVLSGFAVIDRVLSSSTPGPLIVRADGYLIQIKPSARIDYVAPVTSLSDIRPNIWIDYHGTQSSDGLIIADAVTFQPNDISNREGNLLKKTDYDPSKVPDNSKQNPVRKALIGLDPKKIPPYTDAAMQARVDRIGARLIPDYQRNLSDDDPSKIKFRFQLIDNPKFHDALTLPSGVILVPRQIVERLAEDSQIATVLADNIATALEKQTYRMMPAYAAMSTSQVASDVGSIFVPGLGAAAGIANYAAGKSIRTDLLEQSGRVSLGLLHDAGYDLQQAPIAWWLLASKPSKKLADTTIPPRAITLYQTIGTVWRNYPPAPAPSSETKPSTSN